MNHLRRIFTVVATLGGAVLALAATPAAFAMQVPPPGEGSGIAPPPPPVRVITEGGMLGWQIALIALAAALVTAVTAVLLDRARASRKIPAPAVRVPGPVEARR
jgi:hypothetical protein